jgi:hypothetical protein
MTMTEYHVIYEVRQRGAIGIFEWESDWTTAEVITADSPEAACDLKRARLNAKGLETRGVYCRPCVDYYSVVVPYTETGRTDWHPTEKGGPFDPLVRGAFPTRELAEQWAREHLGDTPWTIKAYKSSEG